MARAVLAGVVALALLATPAAAAAKPPERFFGVVSQNRHLDTADFERMRRGNVGTVRIGFPWQEIDPGPAPNDLEWKRLDDIVAGAARHRVRVLPTVYTVPLWVSLAENCRTPAYGPCSITPPRSTYGLSVWRSFLAAAVARYGPDGSFWRGHPAVPYRPIRAWQIWNEQNSPGFFQPRPSPVHYANLLRAAAEAIRGRDENAEIVMGGLFGYPLKGRDGGMRATEYLRELYAIPDIAAAFDGVAIHPYASRISGVEGQLRRINQIITQAGDEQASLWVTEIGWASDARDQPLSRGRKGQAIRLRQAYELFLSKRKAMNIEAVLWYAWQDVPRRSNICKWCARSGLFPLGSLEQPKPAWDEFTALTGGS